MNDLVPSQNVPLAQSEARNQIEALKTHFRAGYQHVRSMRRIIRTLDKGRAWEVLGYKTGPECLEKEIGWSRAQAHQVYRAALIEPEVASESKTCGEIPTMHLCAVAGLPVNEAKKVLRKANKEGATTKRINELAAKASASLEGKTANEKVEAIQHAQDVLKHRARVRRKRDGLQLHHAKALKLEAKLRKEITIMADEWGEFPKSEGHALLDELRLRLHDLKDAGLDLLAQLADLHKPKRKRAA